jgi:hypothetical protein
MALAAAMGVAEEPTQHELLLAEHMHILGLQLHVPSGLLVINACAAGIVLLLQSLLPLPLLLIVPLAMVFAAVAACWLTTAQYWLKFHQSSRKLAATRVAQLMKKRW